MWFVKTAKYCDCVSAMLFSKIETQAIIGFKDGNQKPATVGGSPNNPVPMRTSKITWLRADSPSVKWVYEKLVEFVHDANSKFFDMDLQYVEPLQLTEYDAVYEGRYGQHTDCFYTNMSTPIIRKLSVTVQLSEPEEYEGGELMIYKENFNEPLIADKTLGSVTIFRSHIIHEVMPVTKGVRYSLVAWVHGLVPR